MEETKNDNRVEYIKTTSDKVDSAPKINFNKNTPSRFEDNSSERSDVIRKATFTVVDPTKSDKTSKVPKYPAQPPAKLDSSYMAVAVSC